MTTKGPWIVSEAGHTNEGQRAIVTSEKRIALVDMQREGVKRVERWHAEDPERDANARLIAAAPELLEALKALYEETADYIKINHLGDVHHNRSMQLARSAIAKAEGYTQNV